MPESCCPRLSHARSLLLLLRECLANVASRHSLPANLALDLLPIVEDGLFGYEVLPHRDSQTYVTIGAGTSGAPVVRKSLYCAAPPSALRLASVNGRSRLAHELDAWRRIEQRDTPYPDWTSAAAATWAELAVVFPDGPRCPIAIDDAGHAALDEALATAQSCLGDCDPWIDFCGIPDEAQYGYVLIGERDEHGHLVLRSRGRWELRWTSPASAVHDEWPALLPRDAPGAWARAGEPSRSSPYPLPLGVRDSAGARPPARR